jgi:hypothetical protein
LSLLPQGQTKAFSQNRQAIGGTKEKAVAYFSYQQTAAPQISAQ